MYLPTLGTCADAASLCVRKITISQILFYKFIYKKEEIFKMRVESIRKTCVGSSNKLSLSNRAIPLTFVGESGATSK